MAELKCAVVNCAYNEDHYCSKGDIMVGGRNAEHYHETSCESFARKKEGFDAFTSSLVHPSKTISIDCEAEKCMYNKHYKCVANRVEIEGCDACSCGQTACATFQE